MDRGKLRGTCGGLADHCFGGLRSQADSFNGFAGGLRRSTQGPADHLLRGAERSRQIAVKNCRSQDPWKPSAQNIHQNQPSDVPGCKTFVQIINQKAKSVKHQSKSKVGWPKACSQNHQLDGQKLGAPSWCAGLWGYRIIKLPK